MSPLLLGHISLMSIALVMVITAAVIAKRRRKNWLKFHKVCAISGVLSSILAATCIVFLKISHHFSHLDSPHAITGLITLCLLLITPILGASIAKGPKPIRALHRLWGRITSIAIILTVVMGIFQFLLLNKK
jgi:hypothetical protein